MSRHAELERIADALADADHGAVIITGRSGVGKSRLAREALRRARDDGWPVLHIAVSVAAAAIPLSAVAALLPAGAGLDDPVTLLGACREHLRTTFGGRRVVIAVDDADLLDPASTVLLAHLLQQRAIFVVATVATPAAPPEPLDALWRAGQATRIELGGLDRGACDRLLHLSLLGPVTAPTSLALWDASRGNALYLRELVLGALEDGALVGTGGVWALRAPLRPGAGVAAIVRRRLAELPEPDRQVLDLLAVCGPLGADDVAAQFPAAGLPGLEAREWIVVRVEQRRHQIALAHPLHGAILRESIPTLAARRMLLDQIDRVTAYGARRASDPLRLATWRLDATGAGDTALLAEAAVAARAARDNARAKRLAGAVLRTAPHLRASLVLAETLVDEGDPAGAEAALADADDPAADAETYAAWAVTRSLNLAYRLGRLDDADRVLQAAADVVDSAGDGRLLATRAMLSAYGGRPREALELLASVDPPHRDAAAAAPAGGTLAWHVRSASLTELGRLDEAEELCRLGHARPEPGGAAPPAAVHLTVLATVLDLRGQFGAALDVCAQGQDEAVAAGDRSLSAMFATIAGWTQLDRGDVAAAAVAFRAALSETGPVATSDAVRSAVAGLVMATALAGAVDRPALERLTAGLDAVASDTAGPAIQQQRALAWVDAQHGNVPAALTRLVRTAERCTQVGAYTRAFRLLHDMVRLGRPEYALDRLRNLPWASEWTATVRAHAEAAVRGDGGALLAAAHRYAALDALLVAAETATHAAATGDGRLRSRAGVLAAQWLARCPDVRTPGLLRPVTTTPLSTREREIAVLAAKGHPSRTIAEQLYLSVRTVNNHLQSAYTKLGVSNRGELAAALRIGPTPEEDER
ncbi:LuxR C-terminal-related transcriptional regulator [Dactylosporangium sp. CA-052675]|uniref:LuxR C-terminal-related transcriptional regulator n=1 Tax=Dactylosporangium sp. CA-052675 TaxID=3239927 RepID=UPI003D914EEE